MQANNPYKFASILRKSPTATKFKLFKKCLHSFINGTLAQTSRSKNFKDPASATPYGGNLFSYTSRYVFHTEPSLNEVNDIVPNHESPKGFVKASVGNELAQEQPLKDVKFSCNSLQTSEMQFLA